MFANDYIYDETKVETNVNDLMFYSTGKVEKNKGWKSLFNKAEEKSEEENKDTQLPPLEEQETVEVKVEQTEGKTKPPQPFTDGQLIAMMETAGKTLDEKEDQDILKETKGIGTEATRADIIQTLINRDYVKVSKNRYYVTPKGEMLCTAVQNTLLSSPTMTAEWEKRLKEIGKGQASKEQFIGMIQKFIEKELSLIEDKKNNAQVGNLADEVKSANTIGKCPNCDNGEINKQGKVYKCTHCEQVFFSNFFKKKLSEKQIKEIVLNGKTRKKLKLPKKNGGSYEAYLTLEDDENKGIKRYKVTFN